MPIRYAIYHNWHRYSSNRLGIIFESSTLGIDNTGLNALLGYRRDITLQVLHLVVAANIVARIQLHYLKTTILSFKNWQSLLALSNIQGSNLSRK